MILSHVTELKNAKKISKKIFHIVTRNKTLKSDTYRVLNIYYSVETGSLMKIIQILLSK